MLTFPSHFMSFIDKIKEFFKSKEETTELVETLKIENIDSFIENKKKETENYLNEKADSLYNEMMIVINKLEEDAKIVERVDLSEKKVDERIKNINAAGRKDYLEELNKLIENLREKKEGEKLISHITSELSNFHKRTQKSYYYATQVIGKEMKTIKDSVIKIEKLETEFKESNKNLIENQNKIQKLEAKNNERKSKLENKSDLIKQIEKTKRDLEGSEEELIKIENKVKQIKNSSDYLVKQDLIHEKAQKESAMKAIEQSIQLLIDTKILEKYAYIEDNPAKKKLVESYIENSPKTLLSDTNLEILEIVSLIQEKIKNNEISFKDPVKAINKIKIDNQVIKDYQNDYKKIIEEIKDVRDKINLIKIDISYLEDEKSKTELEIQELKIHLDVLNKKQSKIETEISELEKEIISYTH